MDTGTEQMASVIRSNVEKLGFKVNDIKIILSTHAHFDHVEGHAAMKLLTGAKVMAVEEDAKSLASGVDTSAGEYVGWNRVSVDRVLKDGGIVTLGEATLQAHLTPGHTRAPPRGRYRPR
jgi:metallo-beta-lactamase class B